MLLNLFAETASAGSRGRSAFKVGPIGLGASRLRIVARDAVRLQRLQAQRVMTSLVPFCRMLTPLRLDRIGARESLTLVNDADETR